MVMSVGERADYWFKAEADFLKVSLLDIREINWMAFILDIHTKSRTLRGIKKYQAKHAKIYIKRPHILFTSKRNRVLIDKLSRIP